MWGALLSIGLPAIYLIDVNILFMILVLLLCFHWRVEAIKEEIYLKVLIKYFGKVVIIILLAKYLRILCSKNRASVCARIWRLKTILSAFFCNMDLSKTFDYLGHAISKVAALWCEGRCSRLVPAIYLIDVNILFMILVLLLCFHWRVEAGRNIS